MAVNEKKIKLYIQAEIAEAEARLKKFVNGQKNIKKENDKLKESFSKIGGIIAGAFSVQAITRFAAEAIKLGSQSIALERGFLNLGKAIGVNEQSLEKFRKATDGTVSDVDLMIQANNAMLLGIVQSDDEFAELVDSAQRLAQALGKDTLYGIESLTTGIGRQSRLMLDNLGIIVKAEDAYKAMAAATGKSVAALTDQERKQAFITATMESVRQKVADLGAEQLTAASATQQLSAAFDNLQASIGKDLQDEVEATSNQLTKIIDILNQDIEEKGFWGTLLSGRLPIGLQGIPDLFDPINTAIENLPPIKPKIELPTEQVDILGDMTFTEEEKLEQQKLEMYRANIESKKAMDEQYLQFRHDGLLQNSFVENAIHQENLDAVKELRKEEAAAYKQKIQENMQLAILQGQSAKEAGISVIKAETAKATAALIAKIMQGVPFPFNLALAAGASAEIGRHMDKLYSSFATGGSIITKGRTTLPIGGGVVAGDNASGMERIDFTPLPAPPGANDRNINIYISAPLVDETVVDHIIPAIRRAEKLGL